MESNNLVVVLLVKVRASNSMCMVMLKGHLCMEEQLKMKMIRPMMNMMRKILSMLTSKLLKEKMILKVLVNLKIINKYLA